MVLLPLDELVDEIVLGRLVTSLDEAIIRLVHLVVKLPPCTLLTTDRGNWKISILFSNICFSAELDSYANRLLFLLVLSIPLEFILGGWLFSLSSLLGIISVLLSSNSYTVITNIDSLGDSLNFSRLLLIVTAFKDS